MPEQITTGMEQIEIKNAVQGEWMLVAVTKLWYKVEETTAKRKLDRGISTEYPFGHEILLALPLVENPTTPKPEGTITREELEISLQKLINKE